MAYLGGTMEKFFYKNNRMSAPMEYYISKCNSYSEFEERYLNEFLRDDDRIGIYLDELLIKYEKDHSTISELAGLHRSYVGNIVRGKKNNPSRDAIIAICLSIGTTVDELQYLLKYAGHAPLYVRRRRDVIIWFAFMKNTHLDALDDELYERGYATLKKA